MTSHDYSAYQPEADSNILTQIKYAALKQKQLQEKVNALENALKTAKAELAHYTEKTFPDLMDVAGQKQLTTMDGIKITVKEKIRAHIAADQQAQAFAWLDENGHSNIIKRQFLIDFNKDEEAWAKKFETDLKRRKRPLHVKRKSGIHAATLSAFCRELLENGVDFPQKLFGLHRQRYTHIEE